MQANFSELLKLKNAAKCLENARENLGDKIVAAVDPSIATLTRKLRTEREECTKKLIASITSITQAMESIKEQVDCTHYIYDTGSLKSYMISLQHEISTGKFELQSRISCLQEEEAALIEELKLYESYSRDDCGSEEVNGYINRKGVKKGDGENGFSWNRENQLKYLKARKTHIDFDRMCNVLTALIPGVTREQICEYEESRVVVEDNNSEMKGKKSGTSCDGARKSHRKSIDSDEKMKEKLAAWKAEKKEKEVMQQHLDKLMSIKKMNEELYRRLRNEQAKEKIILWKKEKAELALAMERRRLEEQKLQKQQRQCRPSDYIQQFRKQDLEWIKKRSKAKAAENTSEPYEVKYYARTDPNRVYRPTETSSARGRRKCAVDSEQTICNIQFIKKLAVPTWRKSIN